MLKISKIERQYINVLKLLSKRAWTWHSTTCYETNVSKDTEAQVELIVNLVLEILSKCPSDGVDEFDLKKTIVKLKKSFKSPNTFWF